MNVGIIIVFQKVFPISILLHDFAIVEYIMFACFLAFINVSFLYCSKHFLLLVMVTPKYFIVSTTSMFSIVFGCSLFSL